MPPQAPIKAALMIGCTLLLAACGAADSETTSESTDNVVRTPDPDREMFITDVSVVEDPIRTTWNPGLTGKRGAWTFGRLIADMAPASMQTAYGRSQFMFHVLKTWETDQTINTFTVPARPRMRSVIIDPWKAASGCTGSDETCTLDFSKAPFRLLAIVNRPDLRRVPMPGRVTSGGEGRFVFGWLGANGEALEATTIFEYRLPAYEGKDILKWARRWHALGETEFGEEYNDKLQHITDDFAGRNAAPEMPNGSALFQLRTNEVAVSNPSAPKLWELREFVIGQNGLLNPVTVKNEPHQSYNNTTTLADWINENADAIMAGSAEVPESYRGAPFLSGNSPVAGSLKFLAPGVDETVRKKFATNTCSGCHRTETGTQFVHVFRRELGAESVLSPFLENEIAGFRTDDFIELLSMKPGDFMKDGLGKDFGAEKGPKVF